MAKRSGIIGRFFYNWNVLQHRFWSIVTAADIPVNCQLEGGLLLTHPTGVVIHPDASIGPNCLILQQVTVVLASLEEYESLVNTTSILFSKFSGESQS